MPPQFYSRSPWLAASGVGQDIAHSLTQLFLQLPRERANARMMQAQMGLIPYQEREHEARTELYRAQGENENSKTRALQEAAVRAGQAQKGAGTMLMAREGGMGSVMKGGPSIEGAGQLGLVELVSALLGQAASDPQSAERLVDYHNTPEGAVSTSPVFPRVDNPRVQRPVVLSPNQSAFDPQTGDLVALAQTILSRGQQRFNPDGTVANQNNMPLPERNFSPRQSLPSDHMLDSIYAADRPEWTNIIKNVIAPFARSATNAIPNMRPVATPAGLPAAPASSSGAIPTFNSEQEARAAGIRPGQKIRIVGQGIGVLN